ncbi:MAG TPA: class I SAM-dependent methyltransferase [Rhodothermales bacterium]|nr:class I SAM-dependent methyltransferase [Rhodothermales bacterium]
MVEAQYQQEFWNEEAPTARFSHPLDQEWLARIVCRDARILDYGCGYGRTLRELKKLGYSDLTGLDVSAGMLERARAEVPDVRFVHTHGPPCPLPDASFDLVILFAVLTGIPQDDHQRTLVADVARLLRPSGHLYVSDLPLQTDSLRITRYRKARPDGLPYGAFKLEAGRAVMRHHPETWFEELFAAFDTLERRSTLVDTMRGRNADALQYLFRKPAR